ncbi:unnamed protein product [Adineta ricciae]|uniref:Uncharacterized protein n=1 Tax=Adineta ricciae TaxID=249248 RepID=A0A814TT87_ADIRI|nr:unnamed protein product [Adineta ricciae]
MITRAYKRRTKNPRRYDFNPPDFTIPTFLLQRDKQHLSTSIASNLTQDRNNNSTIDWIATNTTMSWSFLTTYSSKSSVLQNTTTNGYYRLASQSMQAFFNSFMSFLGLHESSHLWKYILYFTFICVLLSILRMIIRHLTAFYRTYFQTSHYQISSHGCRSTSSQYPSQTDQNTVVTRNHMELEHHDSSSLASNQILLAGTILTFLPDPVEKQNNP